MIKEQLVEKTVIAYDELVKVSALKRRVELDLDTKRDMFDRIIEHFPKWGEKIYKLKCTLKSFGYVECDDCRKWKKND